MSSNINISALLYNQNFHITREKNTNLKITHRLVAEDDCKAIGESMGLSKEQRMIIPKLLTGQCVISSSLSSDTHWIIVDKVK